MGDGQTISILLVDDIEEKRYVTAHTLKRAGFHVIEGENGIDCLRLAKGRPRPELIILDVKLPDLDGFEVCRRLKSDPVTGSIPLLLLSAYFVESENKVLGLQSGADAYLAEPISPDELIATVSALLRVRRAEEEAQTLARHWQQTFDAMSDGVGLLDTQGQFMRCNESFRLLLGKPKDEIIGRACGDVLVDLLGAGGVSPFSLMRQSLARQAAEHEAGGRWFHLTVDPVLDECGNLSGAVYIMAEITARKQIEEALRTANAQLTAANAALAEADRRKDEFLAMLAHELRNPLAPVRYAVQIMNTAGLKEPLLQRQTEIINRQVGHMAHLLDDLLDVSRISRGKISLKKERLDLRLVAEQAIEVSRPLLTSRSHRLEYTRPEEPVWVDGDATRLAQILDNLLSNAAKYTEPGGQITVSVKILGRPGAAASEAMVSIRDTGIGIAPEMLPHVFDLFAQADHSLDRSQGGLGIGLTMVRSLVALHGGAVGACSDGPGKGSEFVFRLPLLQPDAGAAARQGALREPELEERKETRCKVLVVEDNRDSAYSLADLLELWGHEVRVSLDGTGALHTAWDWRPDVVLLDIGLPGLSGFEVARRMRAEPALAGSVLVALTGYGQDDARLSAQEAGFDQHLTKPVDLEELRAFIARRVPCERGEGRSATFQSKNKERRKNHEQGR